MSVVDSRIERYFGQTSFRLSKASHLQFIPHFFLLLPSTDSNLTAPGKQEERKGRDTCVELVGVRGFRFFFCSFDLNLKLGAWEKRESLHVMRLSYDD